MELNVLPGGSLWYIQTAPDSQRKTTEVPYMQTAAAIRPGPHHLAAAMGCVKKILKKERKGIEKNLDHLQIRHIQRQREGRNCGSRTHVREWTQHKFQPRMICFLCPETSPPGNDCCFPSMLPEILPVYHIASKRYLPPRLFFFFFWKEGKR